MKIKFYGQKIIKYLLDQILKILKDKLIAANQNNNLYFFNKNNGEIIKRIPTEETLVKNKFINNLSIKTIIYFF